MDAQCKAKAKGADVVKQWDASLGGRTRDAHREADGQIRELDEDFEVGGERMQAPEIGGSAANVCNCRCALLQRARWALENDYTKWSPDAPVEISDAGTTQLVKIEAKDYESFKKAYNGLAAKISGEGIPEHEEPKLLTTIKYSDKVAAMNEITKFESSAVNEKIETACVVTAKGKVYACF